MKGLFKVKIKALIYHLMLSIAVISLFLLVLIELWYPGPLFRIEGVWQGLKILIPVDAVLGPLLTFIVFAPGKKHLKFDLSIIAGLQLAALLYGGYIIYQERPVIYTFVADRFETIRASENLQEKIEKVRPIPVSDSNVSLTYALPAQSREERNQFILNMVQFQKIPERHYPLSDHLVEISEKALNINKFKPTDINSKKIDDFKSNFKTIDHLLLLPFQGTSKESVVIAIDKNTLSVAGFLDINPWDDYVE